MESTESLNKSYWHLVRRRNFEANHHSTIVSIRHEWLCDSKRPSFLVEIADRLWPLQIVDLQYEGIPLTGFTLPIFQLHISAFLSLNRIPAFVSKSYCYFGTENTVQLMVAPIPSGRWTRSDITSADRWVSTSLESSPIYIGAHWMTMMPPPAESKEHTFGLRPSPCFPIKLIQQCRADTTLRRCIYTILMQQLFSVRELAGFSASSCDQLDFMLICTPQS